MNTHQKKKVQEQIYGSSQQPRHIGLCFRSQTPGGVLISGPSDTSSSGIVTSHYGSPISAEKCSTQRHSNNIYGSPTCSSQLQSSRYHNPSFDLEYSKEFDNFDLQSVLQFHLRNNQIINSSSFENQRQTYDVSFSEYQNHKAANQSTFNRDDQFLKPSCSVIPAAGAGVTSKTRIRWTQDLHNRFVECVNWLGGAEKATPKGILRLMDTDGLTIFHVKSHLQKYRTARLIPESTEGKSKCERTTDTTAIAQFGPETGMQLVETLRLQLDVQKRLHEQLEVQRDLQLQIEEQGRQLKQMLDQQLKTNNNSLVHTHNLDNASSEDDPQK